MRWERRSAREPRHDGCFDYSRKRRPATDKLLIKLNPRAGFLCSPRRKACPSNRLAPEERTAADCSKSPGGNETQSENDLERFVNSAIVEHERLVAAGGPAVRKDAPESAVTMVALPGYPRVCVKQFRWRGWGHALKGLFRSTQGVRTFRNGQRLNDLGIGAATPLALARKERFGVAESEWIVMEVIPGAMELDRFLVKRISQGWTAAEKRRMIRSFGRFLGSIHAEGIFHADLKTCNILVLEQDRDRIEESSPNPRSDSNRGPETTFALLDYDDVSFGGSVSERQRVKNLVQVFLSTPISINATDRMLFLGEYSLHAGLSRSRRRQVAHSVLETARGRQILYVGFEGDRVEPWERGRGLD